MPSRLTSFRAVCGHHFDHAPPVLARHGRADDGGEASFGPGGAGHPAVHDLDTLLAGAEPLAQWPVLDERRAASMCYTSGTTGNPKGAVYSHRSTYLHTMALMQTDSVGLCERDVVMPVVPMFHVNAWGLAHGAVTTGATLVMPGPEIGRAHV